MYKEFAAHYDRLMDDVDYAAWAEYVIDLLAQTLGAGPKRVLDAACGTGNLTLPLANAGHLVTGADASEDMLRVAADKARAAGRSIPFVRQPLQRLSMHRPVDAIVCACDGVNYLIEDADCAAFFASAYAALAPGGVLLFDISSRHKIETQLAGRCYGEDRDDLAYLWQNHFDPATRILDMELTFFVAMASEPECYRRFAEIHRQKAHDEADLRSALAAAGFTGIQTFDFGSTDAPRFDSKRIQFIARKAT